MHGALCVWCMSVARVCECVGTCPCVPMWRSEHAVRCLPLWLPALLSLYRVCHGTSSSPFQSDWPVSKLSESLPTDMRVTGTHGCACLFTWVQRIWSPGPHACLAIALTLPVLDTDLCLTRDFRSISVCPGVCTFSPYP